MGRPEFTQPVETPKDAASRNTDYDVEKFDVTLAAGESESIPHIQVSDKRTHTITTKYVGGATPDDPLDVELNCEWNTSDGENQEITVNPGVNTVIEPTPAPTQEADAPNGKVEVVNNSASEIRLLVTFVMEPL